MAAMLKNLGQNMGQPGADPIAQVNDMLKKNPQLDSMLDSMFGKSPAQQAADAAKEAKAATEEVKSVAAAPVQAAKPIAASPVAPAEPVVKLPHEVVIEISKICNRMQGNNSVFPGGQIPQLPFEKNPMHILGTYLCNLSMAMSRLQPYMQRCGDLLQRESLLTTETSRRQTAELVIMIGTALE